MEKLINENIIPKETLQKIFRFVKLNLYNIKQYATFIFAIEM